MNDIHDMIPSHVKELIKTVSYPFIKTKLFNTDILTDIYIGCVLFAWKDYVLVLSSKYNIINSPHISSELDHVYLNASVSRESLSKEYKKIMENFKVYFDGIKSKIENKDIQKDIQNCKIILPSYMSVYKFNKKTSTWVHCIRKEHTYVYNPSGPLLYFVR